MRTLPTGRAMAWRGVRDAFTLPAWTVALGQMGVGSLARDAGQPVWSAVASTALVWAGPAQVIFYGGLLTGLAPLAIAAAVSLSSFRLLPMTMSVLPLLRRPGQGTAMQLLLAHYVAVTMWAESLRRLPDMPEAERVPYYLGFANACIGLATLTTGIGYYLTGALPVPLAAALLFLTPTFFAVSVAAGARRAMDWLAIGLGLSLAPLMERWLGDGLDLLGVGLVGGTLAWGAGRFAGRWR